MTQTTTSNPRAENDEELALTTLRAVCRDAEATGSARASAARTLMELAGRLGRHSEAPREGALAEATTSELHEELARIRANKKKGQ